MPISVKYTRSWVRFFCSIHLVSAVWHSQASYDTSVEVLSYREPIANGEAKRAKVLWDRVGVWANDRLLGTSLGEVVYLLRALWPETCQSITEG